MIGSRSDPTGQRGPDERPAGRRSRSHAADQAEGGQVGPSRSTPATAPPLRRGGDAAVSLPAPPAPPPTRWEPRAGDPGVAAGDTHRIPRVFLGGADLAVLGIALLEAHHFAPAMQRLLLSDGRLARLVPALAALPVVPRPELFPALSEVVWLLAMAVPATLIAMEMLGGYGRLVHQSALRVAATAIGSQIVALSFSALIVFALKLSSSSRVVIFTYALFSAQMAPR